MSQGTKDEPKPSCPNCGVGLEVGALLDGDSRLSFEITPADNQMLTARGIGGMIENAAKLFQAIGKDMRIRTEVYVESIACDPATHAVTVGFYIARGRYKADEGKTSDQVPV